MGSQPMKVSAVARRRGSNPRSSLYFQGGHVKELSEMTDDDVKALKRAFYTFAFSAVGSAVLFAFTVFSLLGKH